MKFEGLTELSPGAQRQLKEYLEQGIHDRNSGLVQSIVKGISDSNNRNYDTNSKKEGLLV